MLEEQSGVCYICKRICSSGRRLAVDHCHKTGVVRGLLCAVCNRSLGWFERRRETILLYTNLAKERRKNILKGI